MIRLLIFTLFFSLPSWASISDHNERFSLTLISGVDDYKLRLKPTGQNNPKVDYKPNVVSGTGVGISLWGFSASYLFDNKRDENSIAKFGKTSYEDVRLGMFFGEKDRFFLNGYYNRFKGLYVENSSEIDNTITESTPRIIHPEFEAFNAGGALMWVKKPDQYSVAASFAHSAQQTSSGGSALVRLAFDATQFTDTQQIIPSQIRSQYGTDQDLAEAQFYIASANYGYGHTFTRNNFFFTLQGMFGIGMQFTDYNELNEGSKTDNEIIARWSLWVATGYNGEDFFATLNATSDSTGYKTETIELENELSSFRFNLGYRF